MRTIRTSCILGFVARALRTGIALLPFALPALVQAVSVGIVSDANWTVFDGQGNNLGKAQTVCLTATAPSNCPVGATQYGYPLPEWTADLSNLPGATWIWAPGISGATTPAGNAEFTFEAQFFLCDVPTAGVISLAADDSAEVFLNGNSVGTATGHSSLSTFMVSPMQYTNTLRVKVKNGPNPADCPSGQYSCNPAGFVLGALAQDALPAWPTCPPTSTGTIYSAGQVEVLSCPPGKIGNRLNHCLCSGNKGFWGPTIDACTDPPTCASGSGKIFHIGDTELLDCPPG